MSNKSVREPLFHVAKRGYVPKYKSWAIRLGSIVAALIVCAVVTMILTGENPISVYTSDGKAGHGRTGRSFNRLFPEKTYCLLHLLHHSLPLC